MTKLNFIYIGKDWNGNSKTNLPTGEIKCIKVKLYDDKFHYVPVYPHTCWTMNDKEVFVPYKGWVKIKNRKQYTIPAFDGSVEHFNDYLNEYGDEVMCFCLNGDLFYYTNDVCDIPYKNEYNCLKYYGPEKFNDYAIHFNTMREQQKKWFDEKHLPVFKAHGYGDKVGENFMFKPELNLGYSFLPVPIMSMNILHDDGILEDLYKKLRYWELYKEHSQYKEYEKRRKTADDYRGERTYSEMRWDREFEDLTEKWQEIDHIIYKDVEKQIKNELELEKGTPEFPQCFKERLEIMFGLDVRKEYEYLLNVTAEAA